MSLPCPPRLHGMPHIRDTILSETLSGSLVSHRRIKTVAGLRWLWLRKEATPTASRTTLSSSLAPRGRGVNTLGRGGCALTVPSSDLFD
ncbi:proline-rich protein 26 [Papio anubis]|uniref:proline-rich protein 26 n=1 Tax=Papio anubis TaxID=9555 RepID=UPI0012AD2631|nr:proline-rich protein 26 [Papio anubis]